MEQPKVSVVMPAYNAAEYIKDALDSIFSQTYRNFEVTVVDDGSTDDTPNILSEYANIHYLRTNREGPAAARNLGIKESNGDLVAFIDSDDIWKPEKLEKQVKVMLAEPDADMCFTENGFFNAKGIFLESLNKGQRLMNGDIVRNIFWRSGVVTPTVMVRRSIFNKVGYFEKDLMCGEDDNLWMRIACQSRLILLDEQLVLVRARENSLSQAKGNMYRGVKQHLDLLRIKYPEIMKRLGSLFMMKHSALHTNQGLELLTMRKNRDARQEFFAAIRYQPTKFVNYLYVILTFLPVKAHGLLRKLKHRISEKKGWLQS